MKVTRRWALCALLFTAAVSALAQDEVVLGSPPAAAPGEVVRVPVFLRDVPQTPLGLGGAPIHWIELSITNSHPHLVVGCLGTTYPNCELEFEPAGVLAASPAESSGTLINISSLYVRRIFGAPLSFTGELDLIGYITFRLDPVRAPLGTVITLQFDPAKTFIANHDGTIVDKKLKLTPASITVAPCSDPPIAPAFDFRGPVSGCSSASPVCRAGEDIEFTPLVNSTSPCDTLTWSFGDGAIATNVAPVRHQFTIPGQQISATYTVTATVTRTGGSAFFSRQVTIIPGCTATVPETAAAGTPVPFVADSTPSGLVISVSWKFGDGTTGSGNPVQHIYQFGVTYLWEATVVTGSTDFPPCIVRRPIQVSGPPPPPKRRPS